jgi:hypothetical protein
MYKAPLLSNILRTKEDTIGGMATYRSRIDWHDLRIAPDDIPEEGENVLVTKENFEGDRKVVANIYLKWMKNDTYCWCTLTRDSQTGRMEETMVWEEIIAWAYYPDPHVVY